jgi:hypothetical protein
VTGLEVVGPDLLTLREHADVVNPHGVPPVRIVVLPRSTESREAT